LTAQPELTLSIKPTFLVFLIFLRFWQTLTIGMVDETFEPSGMHAAKAQQGKRVSVLSVSQLAIPQSTITPALRYASCHLDIS
jgi:hypothetical protein